MRSAFIVLTILFLASIAVRYFFGLESWVQSFAPGIATEIMGIILTLLLVQRLLQRQERARRLRGSIGAFRRAGRALSSMAGAWTDMVKGAWASAANAPPRDLTAAFSPHLTEQLMYIDPGTPIDRDDSVSCSTWLAAEVGAAKKALEDVLVGYSGLLDPSYAEALDELIDDPFLELIDELGAKEPEVRAWRLQVNLARGHREEHFARLLATFELHNRLAAEAAEVRSRRGVPRTGSLGMELPRDHDLKAFIVLDRDWWRSDPAPGALRADGRRIEE